MTPYDLLMKDQYRLRERAIPRLLGRLKRHVDEFVEGYLQERGYKNFKISYIRLLVNVDETGTINNDLARRSYVTKQMMSKTVQLLETEGYVYTQKNPADSRSSIIFLTEQGQELLRTAQDCMLTLKKNYEEIVGPERMEQLLDTLADILKALEKAEQLAPSSC